MHKIELVALDAIKPNPRNARTHSKKQIRQIADSIGEIGFLLPVLINETSTTLGGHGRILAAKLRGLENIPVICGRPPRDPDFRRHPARHNFLGIT